MIARALAAVADVWFGVQVRRLLVAGYRVDTAAIVGDDGRPFAVVTLRADTAGAFVGYGDGDTMPQALNAALNELREGGSEL